MNLSHHGASHDISMNIAGCHPTHPFKDLRSARRARNRQRTRLEKYYHFKGLTPSDLPSSDRQNTHYLPLCRNESCPTFGTADGCWFATFPAELHSAPTAKLTKREAYREAQLWPRPPTYHHSWQNDKYKWPGTKYEKNWDEKRQLKQGLARFRPEEEDDLVDTVYWDVLAASCAEWCSEWVPELLPESELDTEGDPLADSLVGETWAGRHCEQGFFMEQGKYDDIAQDWEILSDVSDASWVDLTMADG